MFYLISLGTRQIPLSNSCDEDKKENEVLGKYTQKRNDCVHLKHSFITNEITNETRQKGGTDDRNRRTDKDRQK